VYFSVHYEIGCVYSGRERNFLIYVAFSIGVFLFAEIRGTDMSLIKFPF
jgi:hypothetical protein